MAQSFINYEQGKFTFISITDYARVSDWCVSLLWRFLFATTVAQMTT